MDTRTKIRRNKRMDRSMGIIQSIYCKQNVSITIQWVVLCDNIVNYFHFLRRLQTKKGFYRPKSRTFEEHSETEPWNKRWRKRLAKFTSSRWVGFHLDFMTSIHWFLLGLSKLEKNGNVSPEPDFLEINAQIPGIARFMFLVFRLFYAQV